VIGSVGWHLAVRPDYLARLDRSNSEVLPYSKTSSARPSSVAGIVTPSVLAVLRLMVS
jgi:hypothetical protein